MKCFSVCFALWTVIAFFVPQCKDLKSLNESCCKIIKEIPDILIFNFPVLKYTLIYACLRKIHSELIVNGVKLVK